ncbi:ExeM/NucH family extracellular endonuclease [Massilia sp. W12]|uniref:ExeM/NucH family extracellular endonuclease n=1 Tax=Massilia sp. W12 TaxID=3126507 RepID=UPI0030CD1265
MNSPVASVPTRAQGQRVRGHQAPGRMTLLAASFAVLSAFATPGFAASDVVISQIYGGGGNTGATYKNDFIELFNRSASAVSLNGWSVQYASATGTSWQVTTLPNVTLQPGQYLLVQQAAGAGGTQNLPTPDKVGSIAMSATSGKVVLANISTAVSGPTAAAVMDLVGFGTATSFETAVAASPSSTQSIARANDGCNDSDNNGADFIVGAPNPRNTASAFKQCQATPANQPIVPQCPSSLDVANNAGGSVALSASDADGMVNQAALGNPQSGISLSGFSPAAANGAAANVTLNVAAGLATGAYPVQVTFNNDQNQSASCTITVNVQSPSAVTRSIPQIQGNGATSPLVGTVQTTEGVVTLKLATGFYMQDAQGDGDPTTSDGIFVYTGSTANTIAAGQKVRVTGTVAEFTAGDAARPITQLASVTKLETLGNGFNVTPANLSLPLSHANEMERYEGMLVRFANRLTVAQNYFLGRYGQLTLSAGRLEIPTNRYPAGSPEAQAMATQNAASWIVLDDGLSTQNPNPIPFIGQDNTVRAGDTVSDLTGVVDFGLITSSATGPTGYKLQPVVTPVFSRDNPRSNAPESVGGNIKVASFNVLNYFTTFADGTTFDGKTGQGCSMGGVVNKSNCRGASNLNEFNRQRAKIVQAIKAVDADAAGLMEMQNNGDVAIATLVDALNAATAPGTYAYVPAPAQTGDDAIRVAMIYKPAKLSLAGASLSDTDAINNRPTLAQTFRASNGKKFSLVVNHLKSKSSCPGDGSANDDQRDGQGCWNALRVQQAQRLVNSFIPQVQAAAGDNDVLVIGDMNAYGMEDPIRTMMNAGLVSEIERHVRPHGAPYSFVFDGYSGYLDHALSTASLSPKVTGVTEWHINADEPTVIDYNTEFRNQDFYSATPYRAADHDPVVIGLNLQAPYVDASASFTTFASGLVFNRSTQTFNGSLTLRANAAVNGPLQVELSGLPAGVTLKNATGLRNGVPYITLNQAISAGQAVSVPLSFSNPNKVAINYSVKIYSGSFN